MPIRAWSSTRRHRRRFSETDMSVDSGGLAGERVRFGIFAERRPYGPEFRCVNPAASICLVLYVAAKQAESRGSYTHGEKIWRTKTSRVETAFAPCAGEGDQDFAGARHAVPPGRVSARTG